MVKRTVLTVSKIYNSLLSVLFFVVDGGAPDLLDEVVGVGVELPDVEDGAPHECGAQGEEPAGTTTGGVGHVHRLHHGHVLRQAGSVTGES